MARLALIKTTMPVIVAVLIGAGIGAALVLSEAQTWTPPLQFSLESKGLSLLPVLGCEPGYCVNVSIGFNGPPTLNPADLRISIVPVNRSVIVNGTPGAPANLAYAPNQFPELTENRGGGNSSFPWGGTIINPDGKQVAWVGDSDVDPGAILCLHGQDSAPTEEYELTFSYHGTVASILVTVA